MIRFTSKREKRLWIAALVVTAGIFLLIFVGRPFASMFRERHWLSNGIWISLFLILITVFWHGWKHRSSSSEIGIWLGIFAVYLLTFLRMYSPEERSHIIEYSVLAIIIHEALKERQKLDVSLRHPAWIALLITFLIGTFDELIQLVVPGRVFDPFDIFFNTFAAILAIGSSELLTWFRKKVKI